MKNHYRIKPFFLFVPLFFFILFSAGCGRTSGRPPLDPKNPVTLTLWNYYGSEQNSAFEKLVSDFNKTKGRELGIIVTARTKNNISNLSDALTASANQEPGAGPMPDIFSAYPDMAYELDQKGLLASLNPYFTGEELDGYVDSYIKSGYFEGQSELKLFPVAKSTEILTINKTDWDKFSTAAGMDDASLETWEGLNAAAEAYYRYSGGKALIGRSSVANYVIVGAAQLGHPIVKTNGKSVSFHADRSAFRRIWDCYYVPYIKGFYSQAGRSVNGDAKAGIILMSIASISQSGDFPLEITVNDTDTYPVESMTLPLPGFSGCERYAIEQGAGMAVAKSSYEKEYAAVQFLKWFTESERNIDFSFASGYLPVKKAANKKAFIESFISAYPGTINPVIESSLKTAAGQSEAYHLYSLGAFPNSSGLRELLGDSLEQKASGDYKEVQTLIGKGLTREEALSRYLTDENFDTWFSGLEQQLRQLEQ